jgi:hypothetical protein
MCVGCSSRSPPPQKKKTKTKNRGKTGKKPTTKQKREITSVQSANKKTNKNKNDDGDDI